MRLLIRKRRWWWTVADGDEPIGLCDGPTYVRARTREKALEKARRRFGAQKSPWEEVGPPRSVSASRCTRDDIDESGGAA